MTWNVLSNTYYNYQECFKIWKLVYHRINRIQYIYPLSWSIKCINFDLFWNTLRKLTSELWIKARHCFLFPFPGVHLLRGKMLLVLLLLAEVTVVVAMEVEVHIIVTVFVTMGIGYLLRMLLYLHLLILPDLTPHVNLKPDEIVQQQTACQVASSLLAEHPNSVS